MLNSETFGALRQFGGLEWIILLIIVGLLLFFGPTKLPEFARSIGRAWGEFRRGKMEVEREIRQEFTKDEATEATATRDEVLKAAKELSLGTEGREVREIKLEIAKAIDRADTKKVVAVAKAFAIPTEGVGSQTLKETIIRRLHI
ncbi:MAG TPA: twin-arginine translocase TatA/TatE family subunit [Thermoplasmata archaeon]|nr:twin-arginine translocase TatA/TatE family subunit [Thermoplasmata archaeon]